MKFLEYIDHIKQQRLSKQQKELIFRSFQAKKRQNLWINKVARYARVATLSLMWWLVVGLLYFSNYSGDLGEWRVDDGFLWFDLDENGSITYADEIGTIIQTIGDVSITNDGDTKEVGTSLANLDKVLLLDGAELTFRVEDDVEAKIVWPAEFELEKSWDTYVINMLAGEFMQITSVDIPTDTQEQAVLEDTSNTKNIEPEVPAKKKSVQLVVKTKEFEIAGNTEDGEIDLTVSQKDGKQVVENTGSNNLAITKVIKDERVVTELWSQQLASINGDVTVADIAPAQIAAPEVKPEQPLNKEQAEILAAKLKNDLTISYKIDSSDSKESGDTVDVTPVAPKEVAIKDTQTEPVAQPVKQPVQPASDIAPTQEEVPTQEADSEVEAKVVESEDDTLDLPEEAKTETKRVIWGSELAALQNATNTASLMRDMRNIVTHHAQGNTSSLNISLANLAASLSPASQQILWGMTLNNSSPAALAASIQSLISNLELQWYVPPAYTNKLKSMVAWLRLIQTIPAGSAEATCNFDCIVDDVLKIPASQRGYFLM